MRPFAQRSCIASLFILAALLYCGTALAATPHSAPLNPDFLAYLEKQQSDNSPNSDRGGQQRPTGYIPPPVDLSHLAGQRMFKTESGRQRQTFPASYDLRERGEVSSIREQRPYGLCWTFATQAAIESSVMKQGMGKANYSEWQLGYEVYKGTPTFDNDTGEPWADAGGDFLQATAVLARWDCPVWESAVPYGGPNPTGNETVRKHLQHASYLYLAPSRSAPQPPINADNTKYALTHYGAIGIGMYATEAMIPDSGVISGDAWSAKHHAYYLDHDPGGSNHGVSIVGWNDSYPRENFATEPPGDGAWIVRNSWGTDWGDNGYFYASYHSKGIYHGTAFTVEETDNYDNIYQYDPLGACDTVGYDSETAWFANVFQAEGNEAVSGPSRSTTTAPPRTTRSPSTQACRRSPSARDRGFRPGPP